MFEVKLTRSDLGDANVRHMDGKMFSVVAATCRISARPGAVVQELRVRPRIGQACATAHTDAVLLRDMDGKLALIATGIKNDRPFFYCNDQIIHSRIRFEWQIYEISRGNDFFEVNDGIRYWSTEPFQTYEEAGSSKTSQILSVDQRALEELLLFLCDERSGEGVYNTLDRPRPFDPEGQQSAQS